MTISDYYPAPFWFLNHKLEKDEITRQLELMKEQHVNSFFMHPRAGLLTPYGSKEFFEMIRYIVEEAEKLGMKAWLYDEDPYPSGQAGGKIIMDNPEFAARELVFKELFPDENGRVSADIGNGKLLEAMAVRLDEQGNILEIRDVAENVGVLRRDFFQSEWHNSYYAQLAGRVDYFHYRAETYFPRLAIDMSLGKGWRIYATLALTVKTTCKYDFLPDNLNPDCVREFIRLTHEKYKEILGDKFGSVIPGIFTDETGTGGIFAWTPRLEEEFKKRRSFKLKGSYFRIFTGRSELDRKVREAYWKTVQELFIDSFYKPVNDWCKKNFLQLCGHGIAEEDPLATTNGMNIFALQKYVGIPGFDHITPNIPDGREVRSLNLGGRLVASAAAQNGEPRVQSECFACNPYNFNHDGMKKIAHWLYALGITWLVPHGFYYSYDGYRKDDAGKSFFFQDQEYEKFHIFADYIAHLGYKLGQAQSMASICILYPATAFRRLMPAERTSAEELRKELYDCVQFMFDNHIQFELADEDTLAASSVENGKVRCGKCIYSTVVAPFAKLDGKSIELLESFSNSGVEIIHFPKKADSLCRRNGFLIINSDENVPASSLMTLMKKTETGKIIYIYNNQKNSGFFELALDRIPNGGVYIYDPVENCHHQLYGEVFRFDIEAYGARLIELFENKITADEYKLPEKLPSAFIAPYEENPLWDYIPPLKNLKVALRDWNIKINGKSFGKRRYTLIRDIAGTNLKYLADRETRPHFDIAPLLETPYPADVSFNASFKLDATEGLVLLAESESFAGNCSIYLNGNEIKTASFKRVCRYDPWNIEIDIGSFCHAGKNNISIKWENAGEFDGLRTMLYVI